MLSIEARQVAFDQKITHIQALGGGDGPPLLARDQDELSSLIDERSMLKSDNNDHELSPTINSERRLWLEIIKQALCDVSMKILDKDGNIDNNKERIRNDARSWFTQASQDFRAICERASLHPDFVRAVGMGRMEGTRVTR